MLVLNGKFIIRYYKSFSLRALNTSIRFSLGIFFLMLLICVGSGDGVVRAGGSPLPRTLSQVLADEMECLREVHPPRTAHSLHPLLGYSHDLRLKHRGGQWDGAGG